jgi:hypothetical protein
VLVNFLNDKPSSVQIITGEEIDQIEMLDQGKCNLNIASVFDVLFEDLTASSDQTEDLEKRMHDMVDWMKKNHLPVKLEEFEKSKYRINILDSVFIRSPFTIESCESTNEIILDKVRQLIKNFSIKAKQNL